MVGPGNQALDVNYVIGPHANLEINHHGSDWYYTACAIMGAATLAFIGLGSMRPQTERVFHYITGGITAVACVAYFAMGSNLGQVPIQAEFLRPGTITGSAGTREIFWVRYIDWAVTNPLLLLALLLTGGVPTPTILITILADEIYVICSLVGALTQTRYKWGFWTFGAAALIFVLFQILTTGRVRSNLLGGEPKKTYLMCAAWLSLVWLLYPVAWGLSEGGNVIHPDSEAIFYGVLDICAKPIFGALLIWGHRNITAADVGLQVPGTGEKVVDATAPPVTIVETAAPATTAEATAPATTTAAEV